MLAEHKKRDLFASLFPFLSFAEREGFFLHFVTKATSSVTNPRWVLIPLRRLSRFFNKKKRLIYTPLSFLSFADREGFFLHFVSKATSSMTNPRRVLIPLRRLSRFFNKKRDLFTSLFPFIICGKRGIRTPGTVTRTPHFECGPIDHSGIFPNAGAKVAFFLQITKKNPFFFALYVAFFLRMSKKVHFTSFYVLRN